MTSTSRASSRRLGLTRALCLGAGIAMALARGAHASCANHQHDTFVLDDFNARVKRDFVGQPAAVRAVRDILETFVHETEDPVRPLSVQLVGPSGTGKTYMAEMMATAIFHDCEPSIMDNVRGGLGTVGRWLGKQNLLPKLEVPGLLDAVMKRSCAENDPKLDSWRKACGIVTTSFTNPQEKAKDPDAHNIQKIKTFFQRAAQTLRKDPRAVLVFDDFVYCKRGCVTELKTLLTEGSFTDPVTGASVSAKKSLIILTTDLREFGLMLDPGLSYEDAVQTVQDAVDDYWGQGSFVSSVVRHVPFTPLTNLELMRITDQIVERVGADVKNRISKKLNIKKDGSESTKKKKWIGSFRCSEQVKQEILDYLYDKTTRKAARAVTEELYESLRDSVLQPEPIEKRLTQWKTYATEMVCNQDIEVRVIPGPSLRTDLVVV
ncbi:Chaperone protein ClpB [Hondaea fermentalgiana]|uniref:Chaperone protein ClpB n=1 Tax=Hondaea fermentalgiana TaxID=2315210 RepID=A0A2R5GD56_9STRA|nr:Chaperone protein ClpB [Hondaea fermentalgiana]|eukprot:GBG28857.1 Chaperone protein ClpB [Hondaea fermentalgiana]